MKWFREKVRGMSIAEAARTYLRGRDLACWCPLDKPCAAMDGKFHDKPIDRFKPFRAMTKEELTEAINDPLGPDYQGYRQAAMTEKALRT